MTNSMVKWVFSCNYRAFYQFVTIILSLVLTSRFPLHPFHPSARATRSTHEQNPALREAKKTPNPSSFSRASRAGPRTVPWRLAFKEWGREQTYCHTLGPLACSVSCQGRRERNGGLFSPRKRVSRFEVSQWQLHWETGVRRLREKIP